MCSISLIKFPEIFLYDILKNVHDVYAGCGPRSFVDDLASVVTHPDEGTCVQKARGLRSTIRARAARQTLQGRWVRV